MCRAEQSLAQPRGRTDLETITRALASNKVAPLVAR